MTTPEDVLRKKIRNCFKRTLVQTEGDTELFDTELTIDELLALINKQTRLAVEKQRYLEKKRTVLIEGMLQQEINEYRNAWATLNRLTNKEQE